MRQQDVPARCANSAPADATKSDQPVRATSSQMRPADAQMATRHATRCATRGSVDALLRVPAGHNRLVNAPPRAGIASLRQYVAPHAAASSPTARARHQRCNQVPQACQRSAASSCSWRRRTRNAAPATRLMRARRGTVSSAWAFVGYRNRGDDASPLVLVEASAAPGVSSQTQSFKRIREASGRTG